MTRGGRAKDRETSERRCVVTRESRPKGGLIRFVVAPDGAVAPDLAERLPGRGVWVSADAGALDKAVAKGHFARAAGRAVKVAPDLAAQVEALLVRRLVDLIALARKAGRAVAGLEKTKAALVAGEAALLVQAADGSVRGRSALRPPEGEGGLVSCLSGGELALAFARDSVIHAAVLTGGLAERIRDEAQRLAALRGMGYGTPSADGGAGESAAGEGSRPERRTTE